MPFRPENGNMEWQPVEVPFAQGVDLRTPQQNTRAPRLTELLNGRFDSGLGIRKRRGHLATTLQAASNAGPDFSPATPATYDTVSNRIIPPAQWSFGDGGQNGIFAVQEACMVAGQADRDNERLFWDSWRLFSRPVNRVDEEGGTTPIPAVMPSATSSPIAKIGGVSQVRVDMAVGPELTIVTYRPDTAGATQRISVYDSVTGAPYITHHELATPAAPVEARCIASGEWVHVFVSSATTLSYYSIHRDDPWNVRTGAAALGACSEHFQVRQVTDTTFALVKAVLVTGAHLTYFFEDGTVDTTLCPANTVLDTTPADANQLVERLDFDVHPTTQAVGLVWSVLSNGTVWTRVYTSAGAASGARTQLELAAGWTVADTRVACAATYDVTGGGLGIFQAFWSGTVTANTSRRCHAWKFVAGGTSGSAVAKRWLRLWETGGPLAIRVGHVTFCAVRPEYNATTNLQNQWLLVDANLDPVARLEQGTANVGGVSSGANVGACTGSIQWKQGQESGTGRYQFYTSVVRRERVATTGGALGLSSTTFAELSIKKVELDFIPKMRSAQFNRSTYFAGGQLHRYDGRECVEAGFHTYPEFTLSLNAGAGTGLAVGTYRYKVRWCYINAQGEEEVSAAQSKEIVLGAADGVDVTIKTLPCTRKSRVYALVYRTEANGSVYYLVSNRDPSVTTGDNLCPVNDPTADTVVMVDQVTNPTNMEQDITGNTGELEPFSAPACTVIASGRDRLWLAGGEIPVGAILPSKTAVSGEVPEFNQFLQTQVSSDSDPITAVAFQGLSTLIFQRNEILAFESDGPNNFGTGSFDPPRTIAHGHGAVDQAGVVSSPAGTFFQSPAGFRLLATNYIVSRIGEPVDTLSPGALNDANTVAPVSRGILVEKDEEVRFYTYTGNAFVFSLSTGEWAVWTGLAAAGASLSSDGLALLGKVTGDVLTESPGVWQDAGSNYTFYTRTAWIHSGQLMGFQRVRSFGLLLERQDQATLQVAVYMDGDTTNSVDSWTWNEDSESEYTRDLARQKCGRVSFAITDTSNSEGFTLVAFSIVIGRRGGLNRVPWRTTS
jgi:hypothetical protein